MPPLSELNRLYEQHHVALFALASAMTDDLDCAEAAVADALLCSWREDGGSGRASTELGLLREVTSAYMRKCWPADGMDRHPHAVTLVVSAKQGSASSPAGNRPADQALLALAARARFGVSEIAEMFQLSETVIRVTLRRALDAAAASNEVGGAAGSQTVLLVDDDLETLEVFADILRSRGYQVQTAVDGHDALLCIRRRAPQVLVTDLAMPRMNGWELVRECRLDQALLGLPIVVVTGALDEPHVPSMELLSAAVLLTKPVRAEALVAAIGQARAA